MFFFRTCHMTIECDFHWHSCSCCQSPQPPCFIFSTLVAARKPDIDLCASCHFLKLLSLILICESSGHMMRKDLAGGGQWNRRLYDNKVAAEPSYLRLKGVGGSWVCDLWTPLLRRSAEQSEVMETVWPLLTSLLSATMISSTYLVVAWAWRLCCEGSFKRSVCKRIEEGMEGGDDRVINQETKREGEGERRRSMTLGGHT